jgi:tripeptidyl-peptidase-1
MKIRNILVLGISSFCSFAVPGSAKGRGIPSSHVLHERHENGHVGGWVKRELSGAEVTLPMRIGLRQSNVDAGHELLMDM